jgi:hypothetical protein
MARADQPLARRRGVVALFIPVALVAACVAVAAWAGGAAAAKHPSDATHTPSPAAPGDAFIAGPPPGDGPVVVRTSFGLRDINYIDDERETFEFGAVLRFVWHDPRQAFDPAEAGVEEKIYQGAYQFNEVFTGWFPQVVLVNEAGLYEKRGVVLRVRPDGTLTLIETLAAIAEAELSLRRYPFDTQRLDAVFEVLGFDADEVVLAAEPVRDAGAARLVSLPQWTLASVDLATRPQPAAFAGQTGVASSFVVRMVVQRQAFFMVRLVVFPLMLIVTLSWTVFWMDRASLGDRINVAFIGILTAVAYQFVVSELLPHISYMTWMNGFLNLSFLIMCASVVVNLFVGGLDQQGKTDLGDRIEHRSRWIFPLAYFGLIAVMTASAFTFF